MSGDPDTLAVVVQALETGFTSQCCLAAACCVYAYDRCLTFSRELDVMLRRRTMSVATGLYMLMHVSMTAYLCSFMSISLIPECRVAYIAYVAEGCASLLFHAASGGFTALRAYAIGGRSLTLALIICVFSAFPVAMVLYELPLVYTVNVPQPIGCVISANESPKIERICAVIIVMQVSLIIPDFLLVVVTWRHTYGTAKLAKSVRMDRSLGFILLRDGTVYFVAILILLILNTVLNLTTTYFGGYLVPLIYSLQVVLLAHFYLDLNEANAPKHDELRGESEMSDIRFSRVVGSLAGSFAYAGDPAFGGAAHMEDDTDVADDLRVQEGYRQSFGASMDVTTPSPSSEAGMTDLCEP